MTMVFEGTAQQYYMDGYLRHALDIAKKEIKNDWDFLFVYDGMEGVGKSVKCMQDAFYCDPTLTLDRYAFTPSKFKRAISSAPKYAAVVYDEAHSGLNSRAAMTMINRSLVSMLTEIRQKNLFVFVVLPTFFDLDKYVALWRSRALVHVYSKENFDRGFFAFYNVDRKKELYLKGKKLYQYGVCKPNFVGRFTKHYPLDAEEYKKLKYQATVGRGDNADAEMQEQVQKLLQERVIKADYLSRSQKMQLLGMPSSTLTYKLRQYREFGKELEGVDINDNRTNILI